LKKNDPHKRVVSALVIQADIARADNVHLTAIEIA